MLLRGLLQVYSEVLSKQTGPALTSRGIRGGRKSAAGYNGSDTLHPRPDETRFL